ncbi:MAG: gamma-glutamyltransferase [Hyphomicrobiaceae bacterium]|nr:gamma-glutamyltransferase [Hyphomicrobiaceae bacterium]
MRSLASAFVAALAATLAVVTCHPIAAEPVAAPSTADARGEQEPPRGPSRSEPEAAVPAAAGGRHGHGDTVPVQSTATRHMVVAANPLAAAAGRVILRSGGNAIDAAIATALVLNLVEPQSSGLGGGAFLLFHDARADKLLAYDGRETAPAAARPDRFMLPGPNGARPMPFLDAVHSGLSVGVPGLARLLGQVHQAHGSLPWPAVLAPALRVAREGFAVSARLHGLLRWVGPARFDAKARAYFFTPSGEPRPIGYILRNPAFAETLETLAAEGADAFYRGAIADAIAAAVANAPNRAGDLTLDDIARYRTEVREPVCVDYRKRRICGMGPPSSGGLTVAQTLKLIEPSRAVRGKANRMSADAMHVIAEAEKLAYADRDRYLADPHYVTVPSGLLDDGYLATRRALIDPSIAMARPAHGLPPGVGASAPGADATIERGGTTHLSVIDAAGNAVAMTATIEGAFGSGLWAAGFLLNNELTDFSFRPADRDGRLVANRVEGGKRPRSSMAPTIVYAPSGEVETVLGSPGGNRIILYVVKALVALIDWEATAAEAAALPNFGDRGYGFELEYDWGAVARLLRLLQLGHKITPVRMTSGLHILVRRDGRIEGGADPRREGVALGD